MGETTLAADGLAELGKLAVQVEAMLDAYFPARCEAREVALRLGYQGSRHGWYPTRPQRRKP